VFGLWFYANFRWIIPAFNPGGGGYKYFNLFTTFDGTPSGVFLGPLLHPSSLFEGLTALSGRKLDYTLRVFGPLAFLSFLSPSRLFLGLPFLAQHLFSDARLMTTIETHHTADLLPFVFFSALWGASHLLRWLPEHEVFGWRWERRRLSQGLAAVLLASSFLFHGTPEALYLRRYSITPHHQLIYATLREIPPEASVSAQTPIAPHLAYRRALYHFPDLGPAPDGEAEFVILDERLIRRKTFRKLFVDGVAALPAKGYEKIRDEDGILLFRKEVRS
jgi:uncharacterized membrane protein